MDCRSYYLGPGLNQRLRILLSWVYSIINSYSYYVIEKISPIVRLRQHFFLIIFSLSKSSSFSSWPTLLLPPRLLPPFFLLPLFFLLFLTCLKLQSNWIELTTFSGRVNSSQSFLGPICCQWLAAPPLPTKRISLSSSS